MLNFVISVFVYAEFLKNIYNVEKIFTQIAIYETYSSHGQDKLYSFVGYFQLIYIALQAITIKSFDERGAEPIIYQNTDD